MEATTPHAVRWITGRRGPEKLYTKWHFTDNANFTACQRPILLMDEFDHKLPDTDDDLDRVDCRLCSPAARQERRATRL